MMPSDLGKDITCKLTGKVGRPVKAHIIPESFYLIQPDKGSLQLLTNTPGRFPKKSPIGVYDCTMVTAEGEACFAAWDTYAAELLLRGFPTAKPIIETTKGIVGYEYPTFDYTKLKLFFLSVLWRAGASSHEFFKRFDLGPHFDMLRNHLLNSDPGPPDEYAVVIAVFDEDPLWAKIMDPFPERYGDDGIQFYRLYVGNFIAYIKLDQRQANSPMRELQLTPDTPLRIVRRSFAKSKERRLMAKIVVESEKRTKP